MALEPSWALDADIEKFFDRLDHKFILAKFETDPSPQSDSERME